MSTFGVITADTIRILRSSEGQALLNAASELPDDRLTRLMNLRKRCSTEIAAAVVELLELRQRARRKFARADAMFFTREGLEQATGENISRFRAKRFPEYLPLLDACCGIGGDALSLAKRGPVLAVDLNSSAAACALANAGISAAREPLYILCADVMKLDLARLRDRGFQSAFFDPSRRKDDIYGGRSRARSVRDYTPPLEWSQRLKAFFPSLGVKVSPAIDIHSVDMPDSTIEFISDRGECKEAVYWFGPAAEIVNEGFDDGRDRGPIATILRGGSEAVTLRSLGNELTESSEPRNWLYEPDPAVIRAGLIAEVAALMDAAPIDPQIAYLTSDRMVTTPFATGYRILDTLPLNLKQIQAWLRKKSRRVEVVKRRGVSMEPDEVRRQLSHPALRERPPTILVMTHRNNRQLAILCEPPEH